MARDFRLTRVERDFVLWEGHGFACGFRSVKHQTLRLRLIFSLLTKHKRQKSEIHFPFEQYRRSVPVNHIPPRRQLQHVA